MPSDSTALQVRTDSLCADYFVPSSGSAPKGAVVVLGGSEGGLGVARGLSIALAKEGFHALAVAYFGEVGLPPHLENVPVEAVGRGAGWLHQRLGFEKRIGLVGVSKGGELALLAASFDDRFKAIVAGVPSNVVWQGINPGSRPSTSSWTVDGVPLPFAPFAAPDGFISIFRLYEDGLRVAPLEAEIEVENIAGPVMLVSATDDRLWPSAEMATRVAQRLRAHRFSREVLNLVYPDAGHAVFGVPVSGETPAMRARLAAVGGACDAVIQARREAWPKMVEFLETALA